MRVTRNDLVARRGYDTKYASHVIRLALQGVELMTDGVINLPMVPSFRNLIVEIRSGAYRLDHVMQMAQELEADLDYAIDRADCPDECDLNAVNNLLERMYRQAYGLS